MIEEKKIKCPRDSFCELSKMLDDEFDKHEGKFLIDKNEAEHLCSFIEMNFINEIRNDKEIDSMSWIVFMQIYLSEWQSFVNTKDVLMLLKKR